jgi:hypothetical protein
MRFAPLLLACLATLMSSVEVSAQEGDRLLSAGAGELAATARLRLRDASPALADASSPQAVLARPSKKTGETLMIVGGAVLLVGLLADEAIISIAGVAVGGYGLYVYLDADSRRR